ncbi:MAG: DUF1579 domain-containing protein [Planctomycetota bacterium]
MTDASPPEVQMPGPGAEHERLARQVGVWKVDCTYHQGGEPMQIEATETVEAFGGFYTEATFEANMMGAPFRGRAVLGFEPATGEYVGTWYDTMVPQLFTFRGTFDAAGKGLSMRAEGQDFWSGAPAAYRTVEEHRDDGSRHFEMFMQVEGQPEMKLFTYVYTRAS